MIQVQIDKFDGPLDLLLQLITKAKIDIKDIFVSEITEQYLEYVRSMEVFDMDNASEFLTMAATLLQIKSRSLLPRPEEDTDIEEEKQRLIQNLYEYKRIKAAADSMQSLAEGAVANYYKLPDEYMFSEPEVVLEGVSVSELAQVLMDLLHEKEFQSFVRRPVEMLHVKSVSLTEKVSYVRSVMREKRMMKFVELLGSEKNRDEIIASFLAVLEMMFSGEIRSKQDREFGDIVLEYIAK